MWLSYRCFVAKGREMIPLFGPRGLAGQIGSIEYARRRKFREKLDQWLEAIRVLWPECPARISQDATGLEVNRATAVLVEQKVGGMETCRAAN
jgi:hypothetical protein